MIGTLGVKHAFYSIFSISEFIFLSEAANVEKFVSASLFKWKMAGDFLHYQINDKNVFAKSE